MDSANCGNDSCAEYLALLQKRLECYFDVAKNKVYGGMTYDFAASYSSRENQTLLSKDAVMDYLDTKELCLVCTAMDLSSLKEQLDSLPAFAIQYSGELSRHHKSTTVTVAFVEQAGCTKEEINLIKRFHFHKTHRFGFWGYTDACAVLVDLEAKSVYCSRFAAAKRKIFNPVEKNGNK